MKSKLSLFSLIAYALITIPAAAQADCPDLSGEYTCQGDKTVITQTPIAGGVQYTIQDFFSSTDPTMALRANYIADGKSESGQALSEEDGGTPVTSCSSSGIESVVNYLYWGINPVHRSISFDKQNNGDIEVVQWDYQGINGAFPGIPHRTSYVCAKSK